MGVRNAKQGVQVRRSSSFFESYCLHWLRLMRRYRSEIDEWPFWYGERPLVGFLGAGIWASKDVCIEEFSADKKARVSESKKSVYPGRADLHFCHGSREGNVEFKMHDVGISRSRDFTKFLKDRLSESSEDVWKGHQKGVDDFAGMFLRPYVGKDRARKDYPEIVNELLDSAWDILRPEALAWWCPINDVVEEDSGKTKNLVVGVILLVKRVK